MIKFFREKTKAGITYRTDFGDGFVIWRVIPWERFKVYRETRLVLGASIDDEIELSVYEEALIFSSYDELPPPHLEASEKRRYTLASRECQPAGIISTIVKMVLHFSGATAPTQIFEHLNLQRSLVMNVEDQLVVAICKAFPAYTPEELEKLDWPTFLKRAAQAEAMLMGYNLEVPFQQFTEEVAGPPAAGKLDIERMIRESQKELGSDPDEEYNMQAEMRSARERYLKDRFART